MIPQSEIPAIESAAEELEHARKYPSGFYTRNGFVENQPNGHSTHATLIDEIARQRSATIGLYLALQKAQEWFTVSMPKSLRAEIDKALKDAEGVI